MVALALVVALVITVIECRRPREIHGLRGRDVEIVLLRLRDIGRCLEIGRIVLMVVVVTGRRTVRETHHDLIVIHHESLPSLVRAPVILILHDLPMALATRAAAAMEEEVLDMAVHATRVTILVEILILGLEADPRMTGGEGCTIVGASFPPLENEWLAN